MVVLPAPVGPTMAIFCPAFTLAEKSVDDGFVLIIAEAHVAELDIARVPCRSRRASRFIGHFFLFQEFEEAEARRGGRLQAGEGLRDLRQRLGEQPDVDHERDDDAEGDRAVHRHHRADDADGHIAEVADKAHHRHHDAGHKLRFPRRGEQLFVQAVKGPCPTTFQRCRPSPRCDPRKPPPHGR